jgi:hypothetical protein
MTDRRNQLPLSDAPQAAAPVACPFCHSTDTELFSLFSQFLLTSQYYCCDCRTVFDVVRWAEEADDGT